MPIPKPSILDIKPSKPTTSVETISAQVLATLKTKLGLRASQNITKNTLLSYLKKEVSSFNQRQQLNDRSDLIQTIMTALNDEITKKTRWDFRLDLSDVRSILGLKITSKATEQSEIAQKTGLNLATSVSVKAMHSADSTIYTGAPITISATSDLNKLIGKKVIVEMGGAPVFYYGYLNINGSGKFRIIPPNDPNAENVPALNTFTLSSGDIIHPVPLIKPNEALRDQMLRAVGREFDVKKDAEYIDGKLIAGQELEPFTSYQIICLRSDTNKQSACNEVWNQGLRRMTLDNPIEGGSFKFDCDDMNNSDGFSTRGRHFVFIKQENSRRYSHSSW